jgi:hypothetical protein
MSIPDDRLSTEFVDGEYIPPEERFRASLLVDYEGGPVGVTDTTQGANFQNWSLSYGVGGDIILTPETTGSPVTVLTVPGCTQISFCFDQNARASVTYIIGANCFLYWYDSYLGSFTTDEFPGIVSSMLSLDDKRPMEAGVSDILWWYTKLTGPAEYTLYHRRQRDRFQTEFPMKVGVLPYVSRAGMHRGLRGKIATRASVG